MTPEELADEVLFPTANEIDASPLVPRERLDVLAAEGWYGMFAPTELGGKGLTREESCEVIEAFAGGCLTTTLIWMQHQAVMATISFGPNAELRDEVGPAMARGDLRSTVAYAGLLPMPLLRARPDGASWIVDGTAPWLSGWGRTDHLLLSARTPDDDVVWLLTDAVESEHLQITPQPLLALNASGTVTATFEGLVIGRDREAGRFPWADWPPMDQAGLRPNGSLALGVANRCCRLLEPSPFDDGLVEARSTLDRANPDQLPAARAAASAFASHVATALVAEQGSHAVVVGGDAERLLREATMLLVFGSRPAIRSALLDDLGATGSTT